MDDFEQLDHYELLGISRSASADEIKQAYRLQMRRFHPDRVASATPEERAYASRRALRLNEAYQALGDLSSRAAYNRSLGGRAAATPAPGAPPRPRDHQAELYERARAHLDAGRTLQAAATLRELQQLNPFYRDSAALLAEIEAATGRQPAPQAALTSSRRGLLLASVGGMLLAGVGAAAWWLRRATAAASPVGATAEAASPPLEPTAVAAILPTAVSPTAVSPTAVSPTAIPTTAPPPTAIPTAAPTATVELLAEDGTIVYAESFVGDTWPTTAGGGWRVGAGGGSYTIATDAGLGNIWAYRTSPADGDMVVGVDVSVQGGEAGLILRFNDAGNYLAFFVDPAGRSFRLEQRAAGRVRNVVDEAHEAILGGADASNRLAARIEGDGLDLRVNGQRVASLSLAEPQADPRYGMVAVSGDGPVEARFRNLSVRALAP